MLPSSSSGVSAYKEETGSGPDIVMGAAEMDGKGSGSTASPDLHFEPGEKKRGMDESIMKDSFLTQSGTPQGSVLVQPEGSDVHANRQPCILPKNMETNIKDIPSTLNGGLPMMSGSYCTQGNAKSYVAPTGPNASCGFSTSIVPHVHEINTPMAVNAPMTVTAACHRVWISQKPPNYQVRNFDTPTVQVSVRVARPPAEGRGKSQLLPRYWPRVTDQELQSLTLKDSNCTVTPLFEKVLSASDAGRVGRLVLPKACAEAYFPQISQAEGVPLSIQDVSGQEWVFQFRFWPNNNSRMYVLEGITPCIQSMRLQAGDTVIFSRIEPGGKLMMGYRKACHVATLEESQRQATISGSQTMNSTSSGGSEKQPAGSKKKDPTRLDTTSDKRKGRDVGTKSKKINSAEFKNNWLEAQRLLQSPPNVAPNIVTIEGYDFEEYEEPPVFGKATIANASPARSASVSNSHQDGDSNKPDLLNNKAVPKEAAEILQGNEPLSGLEALATLATVEENNNSASSMSTATTTKHPRHRPGCSCIVCIQPPSGKGPKHDPNCDCNVCLTVKRRFQTLMLRRKRLQSEREIEAAALKKQIPAKEENVTVGEKRGNETAFPKVGHWQADTVQPSPRGVSEGLLAGNGLGLSFSPQGRILKVEYNQQLSSKAPQIDLNMQPEKEDEVSRGPAGFSMKSLLQSASRPLDAYLKQQGLTNLVCNEQIHECLPAGKKTEDQGERPSAVLLNHSTTFTGNSHVSPQNPDQTTGIPSHSHNSYVDTKENN